jgi:hypothetical protein
MRRWILIFLLVAFSASAFSCTKYYVPHPEIIIKTGDWVERMRYPLLMTEVKLSDIAIKDLGLVKKSLEKDIIVFNYIRNENWRLERLPAGTEVAVDKYGRPWYKVRCSNRIYVPADKICPPIWRLPWGWEFPWWLPLLFLLLFLLLLIPWLIGLLGQAIRGIGPKKPKRKEEEADLYKDRAEHIPSSEKGGKGTTIISVVTPVKSGKTEQIIKPSPAETKTAVPEESIIGIVYDSSGVHIINDGLREATLKASKDGSILIDATLNKPSEDADYEMVPGDKGIVVALSKDGSFNISADGIKPGAEIRLGKENTSSVFVQAEIAKPE